MSAGPSRHAPATVRAFSAASRSACTRGNSPLRTLSSTRAGTTASGTMPPWASSALRRGLSLASTSARRAGAGLFESVGDAPLGEVIGRHFHENLVSGKHADSVLAHFAGRMGDDLVSIFELHA